MQSTRLTSDHWLTVYLITSSFFEWAQRTVKKRHSQRYATVQLADLLALDTSAVPSGGLGHIPWHTAGTLYSGADPEGGPWGPKPPAYRSGALGREGLAGAEGA